MHPGSRREYAVTVPTAPVVYTPPSPTSNRAVVPYVPPSSTTMATYGGSTTSKVTQTSGLTYRPDPKQSDAWSVRVPDANGDGYHKWEYKHVHVCTCRKCEREREWRRERELDRMVIVRQEERRPGGWW